eukprot:6135010-Ditylum_brightwellii.AAC.1
MAQQQKVDDTSFVLGIWITGGQWSSDDDDDYVSSSSTSGEDNAVANESTQLLGTTHSHSCSFRTRQGPSQYHRHHHNGPLSCQTQSRPAKQHTCPHCEADLTLEPLLTTALLAKHDDLTNTTQSISPIRSDGHEATALSLSLGVEQPQFHG